MSKANRESLEAFVSWVGTHIAGDEKGEAQPYLDAFFRALGHDGVKEAGASFEVRVPKAEGKGKKFADLLWPGRVLIEMKKRGTDLKKHFRQALDYWIWITPKPPYVILCNFDEFWIYDFNNQMDSPLDVVRVEDLPKRWGPLAFLFPEPERPTFGNDQIAVTRKAADHLVHCFNALVDPNRLHGQVPREKAQRFILQMLVALFAEDIGLLPRYLVTQMLDDCTTRQSSFDLLGGLFTEMNTKGKTEGGRFAGVDYFNGGLFVEPARLELNVNEVSFLRQAAKDDWSKVRPEIFGTIFEHSLDKGERHAFGAHFTTPNDIMKIVRPTIVDPWRDQIEGARSLTRLAELRHRIATYTVLDPACGSGNFLCIAYRELKRLEARLFERMAEVSGKVDPGQGMLGLVTAQQFFGLDINPFAVELAKVTMMIARKLAIDELHISEDALPLDNLDANFLNMDALIDPHGQPSAWPKADVIIGNPPFLDARRMTLNYGNDYVEKIEKSYAGISRRADFCTYWFWKANRSLPDASVEDPLRGRAGLVGTQNIRNNESRKGGLDGIVSTGTILEAVENQPWSGEANVHVSVVNWIKTHDAILLPATRKLWHKIDHRPSAKEKRSKGEAVTKHCDLLCNDVRFINSSLSEKTTVSEAAKLRVNASPKRCFEGLQPGHKGFRIEEREIFKGADKQCKRVIFPYYTATGMLVGYRDDNREYIIDFKDANYFEAAAHPYYLQMIQDRVLPSWKANAESERVTTGRKSGEHQRRLETWWHLKRGRGELIRAIEAANRYIACSRHMKRPIFAFLESAIRPDSSLTLFAFKDDYSYGIIQSDAHWQWFVTKCSKLKSDFRYTPESVFDTFPWPQSPTAAQVDAVAEAGREVRRVRSRALESIKGGLRAVYRTLELPGRNPLKDAHAGLDRAVLEAYGFDPKGDLLSQLLALNLEVAAREEAGMPVTAPGVPPGYPDPDRLVTDDCIRAS